jgi:uncharacterized protein YkwD
VTTKVAPDDEHRQTDPQQLREQSRDQPGRQARVGCFLPVSLRSTSAETSRYEMRGFPIVGLAAKCLRAALGVGFLAACSPVRAAHSRVPAESIDLPDEARVYSTDPRAESSAGESGAPALEATVSSELAARGHAAVADGALNATARWLLHGANQRQPLSVASVDGASRHFGFAGVVHSIVTYDADRALDWRGALEQIPKNVIINRFGVSTSPAGRMSAVVFASVALRIEPLARFFEPGENATLRGEIDPRFESARVFLTKPDGTVEDRRISTRSLDYTATLTTTGKYRLEVIGNGATGPVVITNVPLFVGVRAQPLAAIAALPASSPGQAEVHLFELLDAARKTAGLHPVAPDDELRQVALGHSKDMADHHFFSHVSPSTGQPAERVKRAGILVTQSAENIAQAPTPQDVHEGLMDSPGHRAAMLEPLFTHVGIAAVVNAEGGLTVTMLFGRRPDPSDLPRSAAELEAALFAMRVAQGLSRPGVDLVYRTAARRGLLAYLQSPNPSPALLARTVRETIQGEVDRLRSPRPTSCAHWAEFRDREQLERDPILTAPALVKFGLDAQIRTDAKGTRLMVVIVSEGVPCR